MFYFILIYVVIIECKIGNLGYGKYLDFYSKIKIVKVYVNVIKRESLIVVKMCYNGKNVVFYNVFLVGFSEFGII